MKLTTPAASAALRGPQRAERVVPNALDDVVLHDADVLVGGGVINGFHCVAAHRALHEGPVQHRTEHHRYRRLDALALADALQLVLHLEQRELGLVEHHQATRLQAQYLATQFRADGPPGAGYQHGAIGDGAAQQMRQRHDFVAAEQIAQVHVADVGRGAGAADHGIHVGDDPYAHRIRLQRIDHATAFLDGCARARDQHLPDYLFRDEPRERRHRVDLQALNDLAMLALVVVEKGYRAVVAPARELVRQIGAGRPGAVDRHRLLGDTPPHRRLRVRPHPESGGADIEEGQQPEEDRHGPRKVRQRHHVGDGRQGDGGDRDAPEDGRKGVAAHVANDVAVQAQPREQRHARQRNGKGGPELQPIQLPVAVPEGEGTPERKGQHRAVDDDGDDLLAAAVQPLDEVNRHSATTRCWQPKSCCVAMLAAAARKRQRNSTSA